MVESLPTDPESLGLIVSTASPQKTKITSYVLVRRERFLIQRSNAYITFSTTAQEDISSASNSLFRAAGYGKGFSELVETGAYWCLLADIRTH